ncbi:MAG: DUF4249 domain-containing protein [Flavobacteriales bacterium]
MKNLLIILGATLLLSSCEKVIDVEVDKEEPLLVVDAFVNNDTTQQQIVLKYSQPYFENGEAQPAIGALVKIISAAGDTFHFVDNNNKGVYSWSISPGDSICKTGNSYRLQIDFLGSIYEASSFVNVAPNLDSLKFFENKDFLGNPDGYVGEFYANDPAGQFDFYRIKTYRNDTLFNKSSDLTVSVNGGQFYPGYDGALFIRPTRSAINRNGEPYQLGNKVKVELLSITRDTWDYFSELSSQINNQGLFATPTSNVRTNIIKTSGNGPLVQGWFCTSALTRIEGIVK